MLVWLPDFLTRWEWSWRTGLWALAAGIVLLMVSSAIVTWVVLRLPATYLCAEQPTDTLLARSGAWHWARLIGKNLLGWMLVVCGLMLSLPGVPGPGLLLVLVGLTLLNFPGKRRLERKLLSRPAILNALNRLRERFGKPPLVRDARPEPVRRHPPRGRPAVSLGLRRAERPRS